MALWSTVETCQLNNGGCDHICTDTLSGIICSCHHGYWLFGDQFCVGKLYIIEFAYVINVTITDINECLINIGNCSHTCNNTDGSYFCGCPVGYVLHPNKLDCLYSELLILIINIVWTTTVHSLKTRHPSVKLL